MSFSRVMPNIKPYPHQQDTTYASDMPCFQQLPKQKTYSVYRPAYHRSPSTTMRPNKDAWATSPEVSPIVVPSMSTSLQPVYSEMPSLYYSPVHIRNYPYSAPPIMHPIHHTLENATISYDTVEHRRELVKDVFFSPAMTTDHGREMSPSDLSTCTQSDSESDAGSSTPHSPPPSEFLLDDNLFDFGLDLATNCTTSNQTTTTSYEEIKMARTSHYDSSAFDTQYTVGNKRRCSDSILQNHIAKKQRQAGFLRNKLIESTALKSDVLFETNEYFDDASGEESDEDFISDRFEKRHFEEDSFSVTSWDEVLDSDSSDSEESEIKTPVKLNQKKKSSKTSDIPLDLFCDENAHLPKTDARPTSYPTIYQKLTKANVDWCRYCGTTEGVNWRPGPWGKRTLCNKHGCDYKGYGFACKLPRLDLTGFIKESIDDRDRPVLQLYCSGCQRKDSWEGNVLVRCEGCPKAYHQQCLPTDELTDAFVASKEAWFCDASCCDNVRKKRIVVELPRKRLPLMCAPKSSSSSASSVVSEPSHSRSRTLRESSFSSMR
ncbi:hypothetical protein A0J61_08874 [Choanephora cucurbitarum]|uniref:Zinc finger PHD-type domain-containing protein n=1 Tax=Choanephora cucurbitarum TaxID=101091 RepID=A0A1C7N359_9FUNG|nr:hypothetical protein A0J61_08874 [Choanephora cucurbitarum]